MLSWTGKAESQGWIIARLGDTPLRHQIELFKDAEVIAGVLGAGLTNLVFASSSTKILSFVPSQMPDMFLDVVTVQTTIIWRGALRARIQWQGGIQLELQAIDDH
jgi:capsular polysaccharide biosynthesis protein